MTATYADSPPDSAGGVQRLLTSDGVVLHARLAPAAALDGTTTAIVVAHGFSASAGDVHVRALGDALAAVGFAVVTYDARGHGASGGTCTLGDTERHDVGAAIRFAGEHADRVVLVGASMGAIAVLRYLAADHDERVAGGVLLSCPARWRLPRSLTGLAAAALTQTPVGRFVAARHIGVRVQPRMTRASEPLSIAGTVRVPVAVVHGERDGFIAPEAARELHEVLTGPRRLVLVPGHGHAFGPDAIAPLCEAVDWVLAH